MWALRRNLTDPLVLLGFDETWVLLLRPLQCSRIALDPMLTGTSQGFQIPLEGRKYSGSCRSAKRSNCRVRSGRPVPVTRRGFCESQGAGLSKGGLQRVKHLSTLIESERSGDVPALSAPRGRWLSLASLRLRHHVWRLIAYRQQPQPPPTLAGDPKC